MSYYHAYIVYYDKKREKIPSLWYNLSEQFVRESIAAPFMRNQKFIVGGRVYQPSDIDEIVIFKSEKNFKNLVLPGGISPVDQNCEYVANCFHSGTVEGVWACTPLFITSPPEETRAVSEWIERSKKMSERAIIESAAFLKLDANWFSATSALQLQEVAVTLVAQRKGIALDRGNVEKVLNRKIESLSFNEQYEAFSKQIKDTYNVEMPVLTGHLRKMRAMVLHEGYNPKPEETAPIVNLTIGLLQKLKTIDEKPDLS